MSKPSRSARDFYIYVKDWLANGSTLEAAFGGRPHAAAFQKYYNGWNLEQGLGGYSTDLNPAAGYSGEAEVAYNAVLNRYQMIIGEGVLIAYSESPDGMNWSIPSVIYDFQNDPDQPSVYVAPVGMGDDPRILGAPFYIYYTRYPTTGAGWTGATVKRFTIACQ
jgi:hypothetical protein